MKLVLAATLALLAAPGVGAAQTRIPPAFLGTWQSLGLNPGSAPVGAPPTELPDGDYDAAVFENLFPTLTMEARDPPSLPV